MAQQRQYLELSVIPSLNSSTVKFHESFPRSYTRDIDCSFFRVAFIVDAATTETLVRL